MAKERNNYEMPTNEDFEDLLQENMKTLKPLEIKEKEVAGQKQLFPFWNAVEPEEVHYSKESYLNAKQKKQRDMKGDKNFVQRMEEVIGSVKNTKMVDMTDAVKPPKNEMDSTTSNKQVTSWDSTQGQQVITNSNAANPPADNVGAVKVKGNELSNTKTDKQVTEWNSSEGVKEASHAANPPRDNVGAVKPKEEDMGATATDKKVTEWDSTNPVQQNSNASQIKKSKDTYGGIDFSKFM